MNRPTELSSGPHKDKEKEREEGKGHGVMNEEEAGLHSVKALATKNSVRMFVCMLLFICVYIVVCVFVYVCIRMCICICMYICVYRPRVWMHVYVGICNAPFFLVSDHIVPAPSPSPLSPAYATDASYRVVPDA